MIYWVLFYHYTHHASPCEHITPELSNLHWLPICSRIDFQILVHTYQAIHNSGPKYRSDLILPCCPTRTLRSSRSGSLQEPCTRLKSMGDRAFRTHFQSLSGLQSLWPL